MSFEEIKKLIMARLQDADVSIDDLTGTGDHLGITVASKEFSGLRPLQQHRLIMEILDSKLKSNEIHAVKLKTTVKA
jgi:acid stress-induced BolA-like protein IbaG/YrbA